MRLRIIPDTPSLQLLLATAEYRSVWRKYSRPILAAFEVVTGMTIARSIITARVISGNHSRAGNGTPGGAMFLAAGDYRSPEFKLLTIVHELSHRLLSSNGFGPHALGYDTYDASRVEELDHRLVYLFEYDVVRSALGDEWAGQCTAYETRNGPDADDPHSRAWRWAVAQTGEQRRSLLRDLFATDDLSIRRKRFEKLVGQEDGIIRARR